MTEDQTEKITLEKRLARLEEILARMESEEIELEEALKLFEEGVGHVREAERVLSETELRVEHDPLGLEVGVGAQPGSRLEVAGAISSCSARSAEDQRAASIDPRRESIRDRLRRHRRSRRHHQG